MSTWRAGEGRTACPAQPTSAVTIKAIARRRRHLIRGRCPMRRFAETAQDYRRARGSGAVGLVLDLDLVARDRHGPLLGPAPGDETTVAEEEPIQDAGRRRIRDTDLGHLDLSVLCGTSARPKSHPLDL